MKTKYGGGGDNWDELHCNAAAVADDDDDDDDENL
jgi:hypothetical protein